MAGKGCENGFLDPEKERILAHLRNKENELTMQAQSMHATLARLGVAFRDSSSFDSVKYSNLPSEQSTLEKYGKAITKTASRLNINSTLAPHAYVPRSTRYLHNGETTLEAIDLAQKSLNDLRSKRKVGIERRVEEQRQALEAMEQEHLRAIAKEKKEKAMQFSTDYFKRKCSHRLLASLYRIHTSRALFHFAAVKGDILLQKRALSKMVSRLIIDRQKSLIGNLMGSRLIMRRFFLLLRRRAAERDVALQQHVCAVTFLDRVTCRRAMNRLSWTTTRHLEVRRAAASFEHRRCLLWSFQRLLLLSRQMCKLQRRTEATLASFLRAQRRRRLREGLRCLSRCSTERVKLALVSHLASQKMLRQAFSTLIASLSNSLRVSRSMAVGELHDNRSISKKTLAHWLSCVKSRRRLFAGARSSLAVGRRGYRSRVVVVQSLVHIMEQSKLLKHWVVWRKWAASRRAAARRNWHTMLVRRNVNRHSIPSLITKYFSALPKCALAERRHRVHRAKMCLFAQRWWLLMRSRLARAANRTAASAQRLERAKTFFKRQGLRKFLKHLRGLLASKRRSFYRRLRGLALARRLQCLQRRCQALHQQRRAVYLAIVCVRQKRAAAAFAKMQSWSARRAAAKKRAPLQQQRRVYRSLLIAAIAKWRDWLRGAGQATAAYSAGRAHWRQELLRKGLQSLHPVGSTAAAEESWGDLEAVEELDDSREEDEVSSVNEPPAAAQSAKIVKTPSLSISIPPSAPASTRSSEHREVETVTALGDVKPPLPRVESGVAGASSLSFSKQRGATPRQSIEQVASSARVESFHFSSSKALAGRDGAAESTLREIPSSAPFSHRSTPRLTPRQSATPSTTSTPSTTAAPAAATFAAATVVTAPITAMPAAIAFPSESSQPSLRPKASKALLGAPSFVSTSSWSSPKRVPDLGLRRRFRIWRARAQATRVDRQELLRPAHRYFCGVAMVRALRLWQEMCERRRQEEWRMADYRQRVQIPRLLSMGFSKMLDRVDLRKDRRERYQLAQRQYVRSAARELLREWRQRSQRWTHYGLLSAVGKKHVRARNLHAFITIWRNFCHLRRACRVRDRQARQQRIQRILLVAMTGWQSRALSRAKRRRCVRDATKRILIRGWERIRQQLLARHLRRMRRKEAILVRGAKRRAVQKLQRAWKQWSRTTKRRRDLKRAFQNMKAKRQLHLLRKVFVQGLQVYLKESVSASMGLLTKARSHHVARAQRLALHKLLAKLHRAKSLQERVKRFRFVLGASRALLHWRRDFLHAIAARGRKSCAIAKARRKLSCERRGFVVWRVWARQRRDRVAPWVLSGAGGSPGSRSRTREATHKLLGDALRARGFSRVGQAVSAKIRLHRWAFGLRAWIERRLAVQQEHQWEAVAGRHCAQFLLRTALTQMARWAESCRERRQLRETLEQALHRRAMAEVVNRLLARLKTRDQRLQATQALARGLCMRYYLRWRSRKASPAALRHAVQRLGAAITGMQLVRARPEASRLVQHRHVRAAELWHRQRRLAAAIKTLQRACAARRKQSRALSVLFPRRRSYHTARASFSITQLRALLFPMQRLRSRVVIVRSLHVLREKARLFLRRRRLRAAIHFLARTAVEQRCTRQVRTLRLRHLFTTVRTLCNRSRLLRKCVRAMLWSLADRQVLGALRRWKENTEIERRNEEVLARVAQKQRVQAIRKWRSWVRHRAAQRREAQRKRTSRNMNAACCSRVFGRLLLRLEARRQLREVSRRAAQYHLDAARRQALSYLFSLRRRRVAAERFGRRCFRRWRACLAVLRQRAQRERNRMALARTHFLRAKLVSWVCRVRKLSSMAAALPPASTLRVVQRQSLLRRALRRLRKAAQLRRMCDTWRDALADWHWQTQLRTAFRTLVHRHFRALRLRKNNELLKQLESRLIRMRAFKIWDSAGVLRRWRMERLQDLDTTSRDSRLKVALRRWRAVVARRRLIGSKRVASSLLAQ